ncbi:hypothetical protein GPECTOR_1g484 [Gonium pectorale]|uniref:Cysteine dioxygenase n=1 Tax=Gonium pectorale TaxID=33097 RepID=A0A150H2Z4_GONPE|nr:hypothetical protein GPECTOR_1g484 [Gonium pectorale]|eukprot:KXZ56539.1 hypothetical protein GPECTOR_1g484 [Gonium pectorale]
MPNPAILQRGEDGIVVIEKAAATPKSCCHHHAPQTPNNGQPMAIEQLLVELRGAFEAEKAQGHVINNRQEPESFKRMNTKSYGTCNGGDWQRFALFNDIHYVRNLVEANEDFELIVICWKAGQVSRVHNHDASHCWLTVLDGDMKEVQYQRVGSQATAAAVLAAATGAERAEPVGSAVVVEPTQINAMKVGDVGYINDHLALHSVGCYLSPEDVQPAADSDSGWRQQGGVTLHLYSPPIRRVKIYEENAVTERTPGYYSKGGVRV